MQACKKHLKESQVQLKSAGLKVTPARIGVLDIFKHATSPLNVKEVAKRLGESQADLVTLYRNLQSLENLGLVKQIYLRDKQAYYEIENQKHHHHLVCKICGKTIDVEGCKVSVAHKNFAKSHGFNKIISHSLEFFGVCQACAHKI